MAIEAQGSWASSHSITVSTCSLTPFISICGTTTLSSLDLNLLRLPRDEDGPVWGEV
jgi:hypothetical protein